MTTTKYKTNGANGQAKPAGKGRNTDHAKKAHLRKVVAADQGMSLAGKFFSWAIIQLVNYRDGKGYAYPENVEEVAELTGMGRRTAFRAADEVVERGHFRREKREGERDRWWPLHATGHPEQVEVEKDFAANVAPETPEAEIIPPEPRRKVRDREPVRRTSMQDIIAAAYAGAQRARRDVQ
jgi:hypothetical protein